jgi:hypothetical protein
LADNCSQRSSKVCHVFFSSTLTFYIREAKKFQNRYSAVIAQNKKVVGLISKEVKKKQQKTIKAGKDAPLRAKRLVREMQNYWRKSEKDVSILKY